MTKIDSEVLMTKGLDNKMLDKNQIFVTVVDAQTVLFRNRWNGFAISRSDTSFPALERWRKNLHCNDVTEMLELQRKRKPHGPCKEQPKKLPTQATLLSHYRSVAIAIEAEQCFQTIEAILTSRQRLLELIGFVPTSEIRPTEIEEAMSTSMVSQ